MSFAVKIGNYRFSKNLGVGTFGKVKLALNEITGHKVAIKILNKNKIKQQGVFEKVKREIKVLRRFNHPHIIKHFEFIDTASDVFIVLEYAAGGELFDLISRRERLDEPEARRIFQQIISAIEYSHLHKMAHRDLKPENLLLDEQNNIKLIDFGLANSMRDAHTLKTACGSPNYAAPEVISGQAYGGQEVDIWSCGVILYAMICGSLPFDDDSLTVLFNKIKDGHYFIPNYVSIEVKDLISRMLQPNPVKRISLKEIQQHAWFRQDMPDYLKELSQTPHRHENVVDKQIDKRITKSFEDVCRDIRDKKNIDYCGAYELIKHDKLKLKCFNDNHTQKQNIMDLNTADASEASSQQSFYSNTNQFCFAAQKEAQDKYLTQNQIQRLSRLQEKFSKPSIEFGAWSKQTTNQGKSLQTQQAWQNQTDSSAMDGGNGHQFTASTSIETQEKEKTQAKKNTKNQKYYQTIAFQGDPLHALQITCQALAKLEIEWQFDKEENRLKCRLKLDNQIIQDDDQFIQDFLRRNFIKFYVSILKEPSRGMAIDTYMLSIQLIKGTPCVFLDFCHNLIAYFKLASQQRNKPGHDQTIHQSDQTQYQKTYNISLIQ